MKESLKMNEIFLKILKIQVKLFKLGVVQCLLQMILEKWLWLIMLFASLTFL